MNGGWIKLHRELVDKPIWACSTIEQKVILITLLLMANHNEKEWEWKGKKFICKPGQFIASASNIAQNAGAGISRQNIRTALDRFERYGFITIESTNKSSLITICNWGNYQSDDLATNQQANQRPTSDQPATNQRLTTNKNDKNDKKTKKEISTIVDTKKKRLFAEFVSMSEDEYGKLSEEYGKEAADGMIEILNNYKGANGKKYKSDYLAIRNWVVSRWEEQSKRNGQRTNQSVCGSGESSASGRNFRTEV